MDKRGDLHWEKVAKWLIVFAVLALVIFGIILFTGKDSNALAFIKDLLRFRA